MRFKNGHNNKILSFKVPLQTKKHIEKKLLQPN